MVFIPHALLGLYDVVKKGFAHALRHAIFSQSV